MKKHLLVLVFLFSVQTLASSLSCLNEIGGSWSFAAAPSACDVSPMIDPSVIANEYSHVIYEDSSANLQSYLSHMYPLLRDIGKSYIHRRNPQVTDTEEKAFLEGLFTLAHQESFWTHYRHGADQVIRYMRGDALHGHGLMQVDDRSHVDALKQGRGVDLVYNIMFGLDIYYQAWVSAPQQSCLKSATDYQDRARAAWAAYNGGLGAICRWRNNPSGGDRQYLSKILQKQWLQFVVDQNAPVLVDVQCLMLGQRPCLGQKPRLSNNGANLAVKVGDRIEIAAPLGINLRHEINGQLLGRLPKTSVALVEDIAVQSSEGEIYLKIKTENKTGFIYAGHQKPKLTLSDWIIILKDAPQMILRTSIQYEFLRACGDLTCAKTSVALQGKSHEPVSIISKNQQAWVEVETLSAKKGWIAESDLEEIQ
jgi:hypothetical protein